MSIAVAVPASTVVLLRGDHPFEVFLVRRSDSVAFLGGAHVFPGGRVDPADRIHDVVGGVRLQADSFVAATENLTSRMPDVPADVVIAHHVAAVRELFAAHLQTGPTYKDAAGRPRVVSARQRK